MISNIHMQKFTQKIILFLGVSFILPLSIRAQSKYAIAKNGDGIYRLLRRNHLLPGIYIDKFIELNKKNLGRDNSLYVGIKYLLPDVNNSHQGGFEKSIVQNGIFGEKYANIRILNNKLKGAVYYLISGHGGPDPGAMTQYNGYTVCEDEYAYDVVLRLARNLISEGATVYLITQDKNDGIRDAESLEPDKDEVCYPDDPIPLNHLQRLQQRTDAVNKLYKKNKGKFQRAIAIHVDSRNKDQSTDIFFYYDERSKSGIKTAEILRKTVNEKYGRCQPNRGYEGTASERDLYVVRNTFPTAIFIELGNMNNSRDVKRLVMPRNRQLVADWLTIGLEKDFKTSK